VATRLGEIFVNQPIPNNYQLKKIKQHRHAAQTIIHDDVFNIRNTNSVDKQFIYTMSLTIEREAGFYVVCMLPNMVPYLLQYGENMFFIDGVAILPQYGYQLVAIHVKVNGKPVTVAFAVVSR
jgi:hypothetical protein